MRKRFSTPIKSVATLTLVLVFTLSFAGAITYDNSKVIGDSGGSFWINGFAHVKIENGALTDYLDEQGLSSVEITVEMNEVYDDGFDAVEELQNTIDALQGIIDNNPQANYVSEVSSALADAVDARDELDQNNPSKLLAILLIEIAIDDLEDAIDDGLDATQGTQLIDGLSGISDQLVDGPDRLMFTFGPSGACFDPNLKLTLAGNYINNGALLYGEDGEALEYQSYFNGWATTFYIPHFSEYYYDDYY